MNEFLIWFVGIILFIAAIIDIKTREVPDFLSYTLIAVALASNAISSAAQLSFLFFHHSGMPLFQGMPC